MFSSRVVKHVLFILLLPVLAQAAGKNFVFQDGPTSPTTPPSKSFSDAEMVCLSQQKVLYSDGECYKLRQKGPCETDHWLVLDDGPLGAASRRKPVCKMHHCQQPLRVYWPEDGQCHKLSDKDKLCPYGGNELRADSYGDGDCGCMETYVRYEPDVTNAQNALAQWRGICYELYKKGPCRGGNILHPKLLQGFGIVGYCAPDPCRRQNTQNRNSTFAQLPSTGVCYKLGTEGTPCGRNETFDVHPVLQQPRCFVPTTTVSTNSLYQDMEERCGGNMNIMTKECREELEIRTNSLDFVTDMQGKPHTRRVRSE